MEGLPVGVAQLWIVRHHSHHKQNMTPRNLFKLAVRLLGLVFLYHGLIFFPTLFTGIFGSATNAFVMILMFVWPVVVAFCLLGFAPKITDFFYPKSED
jgi:hypothetical protein